MCFVKNELIWMRTIRHISVLCKININPEALINIYFFIFILCWLCVTIGIPTLYWRQRPKSVVTMFILMCAATKRSQCYKKVKGINYALFFLDANAFIVQEFSKTQVHFQGPELTSLWQLCAAMMSWVGQWVELVVD